MCARLDHGVDVLFDSAAMGVNTRDIVVNVEQLRRKKQVGR
jgi:hypothetical protein